jgi:hypothetical protein
LGDYYAVQGGSRILDATRTDQSTIDDGDVIDWTKTNDFILAVNIHSGGKDTVAAQYKLRWRNKTDSGTFADMASTGAINYSADTDLVNGASIAVGGRKCSTQGDTWQDGEEVEGVASSDSIDLATDYETEIHFALDCSGATDNKEYEFELYDDTLDATRGTCGATIKMAGAASIDVSLTLSHSLGLTDAAQATARAELTLSHILKHSHSQQPQPPKPHLRLHKQ